MELFLVCFIIPPYRWYIPCRGRSSRSSSTPGRSRIELPARTRDSNPNSTPVSLGSGSGPPTTCLRWRPQNPPRPLFPREDRQTRLKEILKKSTTLDTSFNANGTECSGLILHRILYLTCSLALFLIVLFCKHWVKKLKLLISVCAFGLTFHRFFVGISVGQVGGDGQGAAVGAGLDGGRLEQQRFPGRAVSQSHHLPWATAAL